MSGVVMEALYESSKRKTKNVVVRKKKGTDGSMESFAAHDWKAGSLIRGMN